VFNEEVGQGNKGLRTYADFLSVDDCNNKKIKKVSNSLKDVVNIREKILDQCRKYVTFDSFYAAILRSKWGLRTQRCHLDFLPDVAGMKEAFEANNGSGTHFKIVAIDKCSIYVAEKKARWCPRVLQEQKQHHLEAESKRHQNDSSGPDARTGDYCQGRPCSRRGGI